MVHFKQLENGIRLVVKKMDGLMSVTMGVLVGTGACYETDAEDGISHFIEHMMFKGTKTRSSFTISDEMDRIGAEKAFEILADLFLNSTFPEEEMVKEKGVIIEEINMNEDTPDDLCLDLVGEAYYGKGGYGRNILGPRKNVSGFMGADVRKYMALRYTTDNIVVAMAGNIDIELAEDMTRKYFSALKPSAADKRVLWLCLGELLYFLYNQVSYLLS